MGYRKFSGLQKKGNNTDSNFPGVQNCIDDAFLVRGYMHRSLLRHYSRDRSRGT